MAIQNRFMNILCQGTVISSINVSINPYTLLYLWIREHLFALHLFRCSFCSQQPPPPHEMLYMLQPNYSVSTLHYTNYSVVGLRASANGPQGQLDLFICNLQRFFIPKLKNKKQTKKIPQIKIRTFENVFATSVSCHQMVLKSKTDVKSISVPVTALNLRLEKNLDSQGQI